MLELQRAWMRSLRETRVRLSNLAMPVIRAILEVSMVEHQSIHLNLFVDGSPQWRGEEPHAGTLNLVFHGFCREGSAVRLHDDRGDMLWQRVLHTGPSRRMAGPSA